MHWIVLAGILLGVICFVSVRTLRKTSDHELGKGRGNAGSARYKNRGSRQRDGKNRAP